MHSIYVQRLITSISDILNNKESLPFNENILSDYVNSKIPLLQPDFSLGYINDDQVLKLLSTLYVNKSSGKDNLGPRILKLCAPIIYKAKKKYRGMFETQKVRRYDKFRKEWSQH